MLARDFLNKRARVAPGRAIRPGARGVLQEFQTFVKFGGRKIKIGPKNDKLAEQIATSYSMCRTILAGFFAHFLSLGRCKGAEFGKTGKALLRSAATSLKKQSIGEK